MNKKVGWGTEAGGKLSRKDAEYVQTVVKRAKDLIFYNDEFGRPERKRTFWKSCTASSFRTRRRSGRVKLPSWLTSTLPPC